MWTDKRKLSAADCDEGHRPPIKTSAKLMVCQAKDGSIRTRKIASTDHDYLQKETESTSLVINDPIGNIFNIYIYIPWIRDVNLQIRKYCVQRRH